MVWLYRSSNPVIKDEMKSSTSEACAKQTSIFSCNSHFKRICIIYQDCKPEMHQRALGRAYMLIYLL